MDPNVTLAAIRELIKDALGVDQVEIEGPISAYELTREFQALDEWLSEGGPLPDSWDVNLINQAKDRAMKIKWTTVHTETDLFTYEGKSFAIGDFQHIRSPWGDAPGVDTLEEQGVGGWMPRVAGNDDPYFYVINFDDYHSEDIVRVALINAADLPE